MSEISVEPTAQYILRLKCDVIRASERWQETEHDSQEEADAEKDLRVAVSKLLRWCPEYEKKCTMLSELEHTLRQEVKE